MKQNAAADAIKARLVAESELLEEASQRMQIEIEALAAVEAALHAEKEAKTTASEEESGGQCKARISETY